MEGDQRLNVESLPGSGLSFFSLIFCGCFFATWERTCFYLGANCSLELLDGVHLVTAGEGGQPGILLPLHRCVKLNEIQS